MPVSGIFGPPGYMHRVGRTGRFGLSGVAVNFIAEQETEMQQDIQQHFQITKLGLLIHSNVVLNC